MELSKTVTVNVEVNGQVFGTTYQYSTILYPDATNLQLAQMAAQSFSNRLNSELPENYIS